jgi:nicotinamidase-related amidase
MARHEIGPTLILIDLQKAIDDPRWAAVGPRNNPEAEANVARLLAAWRARNFPIIHVRHDSRFPDSPYRQGAPGHAFKPEAEPLPGEKVIAKQTNSAFATRLPALLGAFSRREVVICGVITENSVESSVRDAGDMGFEVTVVEDAVFTFAKRDWAGVVRTAEEVHAMSLANMSGEYARVATTEAVLAELER